MLVGLTPINHIIVDTIATVKINVVVIIHLFRVNTKAKKKNLLEEKAERKVWREILCFPSFTGLKNDFRNPVKIRGDFPPGAWNRCNL